MNKGWKCANCGHEHPQSDDLAALGFYMTDQGVCITRCQACGSYVIAHRTGLHSGQFLVVKSFIKQRGTKSKMFKGVIGPDSIQYIYDRLTAVVGDFLEADKAIDAAYSNRADLAAEKVQLDTEIKLDESDALMAIQGEGKSAFVMIGDQRTFLTNEQARDAYRRTVTKVKREKLAQVESQIARIDIEIARAKDKYKTAADAADSLKATASVQASLLNAIAKGLGDNDTGSKA